MKFGYILCLASTLLLSGCGGGSSSNNSVENPGNGNSGGNGGGGNVAESIELSFNAISVNDDDPNVPLHLEIGTHSGSVTVDWLDGSDPQTADASAPTQFTHEYPSGLESRSLRLTFEDGLSAAKSLKKIRRPNSNSATFTFSFNVLKPMDRLEILEFNFTRIEGELKDLPKSLRSVQLIELGIGHDDITGSTEELPRQLTSFVCYCGGFIRGQVADLPDGLETFFWSTGYQNALTGNFIDLPRELKTFYAEGVNALFGDFRDLPEAIKHFTLYGENNDINSSRLDTLPNTLERFFLQNGGSIGGSLDHLAEYETLNYFTLDGANTLEGNIGNLPDNLLTFSISGGSNTISGDISGFPRKLTEIKVEGNNTIDGDVGDMPPELMEIILTGDNVLRGNIANIPRTMKNMTVNGRNTLTGDIGDLSDHSNLNDVLILGNNTLFGDVGNLPSGLMNLTVHGGNILEGDIQDVPSTLNFIEVLGNNVIGGDLALLDDAHLQDIYLEGFNTVRFSADPNWDLITGNFELVLRQGGVQGFTQLELDNFLNYINERLDAISSSKMIVIQRQFDALPSQASAQARRELEEKGYTLEFNNNNGN